MSDPDAYTGTRCVLCSRPAPYPYKGQCHACNSPYVEPTHRKAHAMTRLSEDQYARLVDEYRTSNFRVAALFDLASGDTDAPADLVALAEKYYGPTDDLDLTDGQEWLERGGWRKYGQRRQLAPVIQLHHSSGDDIA